MRIKSNILGLAAAFAAQTVLGTPAYSTVLTFDGFGDGSQNPPIPADYGDRVTVTPDANGYEYGGGDGFTPNVVVDYIPDDPGQVFELWDGYGDLDNALGDNSFGVPGEIFFTPDPGFAVRLNSFDMAYWGAVSPNARVQILGEAGNVLYDSGVITPPAVGHMTLPDAPVVGNLGEVLRLRVEDIGDQGIDNVNFSQISESSLIPLIAEIPDAVIPDGVAYVGPPPVLLEGIPPVTWVLSAGPAEMTVDPDTGVVAWSSPAIGTYTVTIEATNTFGTDAESWLLTVALVPLIEEIPDATIATGAPYTGPTPTLVQGGPTATWSLPAGPAGMTIDPTTGVVAWADPAAGTPPVTVRADNGIGTDDESWTLTVLVPPVIDEIADVSIAEDAPYTGPVPSLLQGSAPITWSLVGPPAGMTIDPTTGVVTWPEPAAAIDPYTITIEASNAAASDTESWALSVPVTYTATVAADVEVAVAGTAVMLAGEAVRLDSGAPEPNVPVTVRITIKGTRRVFEAVTDAAGAFSMMFQPLPGEAGLYSVAADHPAIADDIPQDEFTLVGMRLDSEPVTIRVAPGTPVTAPVDLRNLGDTALTGISAVVTGAAANLDIQIDAPSGLASLETAPVTYTVTAADASVLQSTVEVTLISAEGAATSLSMDITVVPVDPVLAATPASLEVGMLRGEQTFFTFEVSNTGGAPATGVTVLLPSGAPWLTVVSSPRLDSLGPGETANVVLSLLPAADLPLGPYEGTLYVADQTGARVSIPFLFRAISEAVGDLKVNVVDEFTYYVDGAPRVADATVVLTDVFDDTIVAQGVTDSAGVATIEGVPEGTYTLEVRAERHGTFKSPYNILPGVLNEAEIFLQRQVVTFDWNVVQMGIEDGYRIVLEAIFETHVPIPVVTFDKPVFLVGVADDEPSQIELTLTNHGLIAAQDVVLSLGQHPNYILTPLVEDIGDIPAMTSITIPVLIQLRGAPGAPASTAAPEVEAEKECVPFSNVCVGGITAEALYRIVCGPFKPSYAAKAAVQVTCLSMEVKNCLKNAFKGFNGDLSSIPGNVVSALLGCGAGSVAGDSKDCVSLVLGILTTGVASPSAIVNCSCYLSRFFHEPAVPGQGSSGATRSRGGGEGGSGPGSVRHAYTYGRGGGWGTVIDCGDDPFSNPEAGGSIAAVEQRGGAPAAGDPAPAGVCARVRIRIEQEAVMTRSAFRGVLKITNEDEAASLEGIAVDLAFFDDAGGPADDLFVVRPPVLSGLAAVDGSGALGPQARGTVEYTIIPTADAAVSAQMQYHFGGTLRYVDQGEEVVVPLYPARITVLPDASLQVRYYLERDIFSDDPFTEERVEPATPFSLGLMIINEGMGAATNVSITSAQPQIIENDKGLLIAFEIIGTQVGSEAVEPSLTVNLGEIAPGDTAVARWRMTASLQGRFCHYEAAVEHLDGLGDPRLSLIDSVRIFEMIHAIRVDDPIDDELPDFLVVQEAPPPQPGSDCSIPDEDNLPTVIHSSAGPVLPISAVTEAVVDSPAVAGDLEVEVTATLPAGWVYLRIDDPAADQFVLSRVVRSDGREVRLDDNAWRTHRIIRLEDEPPFPEDRLHLVDRIDTPGDVTYTVTYAPDPVVPLPTLVRIVGTDDAAGPSDAFVSPKSRHVGLDSVDILVSEAVQLVSACTTSAGGAPPAVVGLIPVGTEGVHAVQFDGPIELGEWTTVTLSVANAAGVEADLCFVLGRLPGDVDQNGQLNLADATRFGQIFRSGPASSGDLDGDGEVNVNDATKFGQIWRGTSGEEDPRDGLSWNGKGLGPKPECACP